MKIEVTGQSTKTDKWVKIIVLCEQSVYTCSMSERETSLTTYLKQEQGVEQIVVYEYESGCTIPHKVENEYELYYHICLWDYTDKGLMDVTIDFKIHHAKWTVFADDYDEANIRCSRD